MLGKAISNAQATSKNIQNIILTGEMPRFGDAWLQSLREAMRQVAFTKMAQDTKVELGKTALRGCILGASASMLLDNYSLLFINHRK